LLVNEFTLLAGKKEISSKVWNLVQLQAFPPSSLFFSLVCVVCYLAGDPGLQFIEATCLFSLKFKNVAYSTLCVRFTKKY